MRGQKESKRSKESAASASGTLGDLSEEAVAKLVRRANRSGKKKCENQLHPCDLIGKQESRPQRDKKDVDATVGSNALETQACSRDALQKVSRDAKGDGESFQCSFTNSREELNDSDWEDGPVPISNSMGGHEVTIEINETPDSRRRKRSRRASVEDKELAELVHKAHLLCLIARGRLIDRACDDALIQASLLSLLPEHLLHISKVAKLAAKHLFPLVCWFQNNFRVRTTSVRRSFHSALNFALETREGTQEEIAALSVALLRALNLTTRLVSILNVASLKPEADKTDCSSEDASRLSKGIFSTSTPMVARRNEVPVSPATSSERNSVGETPQIGSYKSKDCHLTSSKTRCKGSYAYELNDKMSDTLACEEWNDMSEACHTKKSQESKRRGDLEFEMQLQMALSATAVPTAGIKIGSDNKDSHSNAAKRLKRTVCEESPISSQSISTAVGSRKEGSPLYWAEVYCNGENLTGKWLHIDAINAIIDGELKVEAVAAACKTPLRYVVAFAGNGAKDVTRRTCVQTLKTKHKWLREGLQVKPNERPVKELKRSIKLQKVQVLEDDDYVGDNSIGTIELYGKWQLDPLHLPHAINGIVPKNDHGNVEVWSEKCLPPGTVHLRLPRVFSVAKRLEIDYAPAMVDFEFKNGQSYPVFDGIVVCAEFKDAILEAYAEEQDRREAVEKKRYEMQAISRWYQLLSSIVTRQRIQNRYGESSSTASAETENVNRKLDVQLGGGQNDEEGGLHENTPDDPTIELDNHEHVFLTENQSFDEDNLVVTKRCLCGFSVQVEEL